MKKGFVVHVKFQDLENVKLKVDEIVAITKGKVNPFVIDDLWKQVQKGMTSADTSRDYIVPAGNTLVNFLAGLALGMRSPKKVKLMVHDATNGHYKELVLNLEEDKS